MPGTKKIEGNEAQLIVASGEKDSNMFYATGFSAPEPLIWLETDGKTELYVNHLELGRAQKEADVDEVIDDSEFEHEDSLPLPAKLINILKTKGVKKVVVPKNFEIQYAEKLFRAGIKMKIKPGIFFEKRAIKTQEEVQKIREVQKITEQAMEKAVEIISASESGEGNKLYWRRQVLTSELVREAIHIELLKGGCGFEPSIVACGKHSADPHQMGKGPLFADQPIVIDIFPRSQTSKYFADMTRTVVKGEASPAIQKIYDAVLEAQEAAIAAVKKGIKASEIDLIIRDHFEKCGFKTEKVDGIHQGFIHATGHGVGIDLHESPIIYKNNEEILEVGNVFTVEPGLYYHQTGGVRIEDLVVVTEDGVENLTKFPKANLTI